MRSSSAPTVQQYFNHIPWGTFVSFIICVALQVGTYVFGLELRRYTIYPAAVIYQYEWHRIITSAFFHNGLIHIGFNMLSLLTLGPAVEKIVGTFRFILYICVCVILSNVLYVIICYILAIILKNPSWLYYNSVGYSGLLFAFATIESFLSLSPTRSFFGCNVPSKYYPFVMLIGIQIMMPNISFLGHLCGLFIGILYVFGMLEMFLPTRIYVQALEEKHSQSNTSSLSMIIKHQRYCLSPSNEYLLTPPSMIQNGLNRMSNVGNNISSFITSLHQNSSSSSSNINNASVHTRRGGHTNRNGYSVLSTFDNDDDHSSMVEISQGHSQVYEENNDTLRDKEDDESIGVEESKV